MSANPPVDDDSVVVGVELDRTLPIPLPGSDKTFPATMAYESISPSSNRSLFLRAPCFDLDAVLDGSVVPRYVRGEGYLPGYIPLESIDTSTWRRQFCFRDADLH